MKSKLVSVTFALVLASPAFADGDGDAAKGEKVFKQCQTCHVVVAPDGTVLAGHKMKTGPNLYGVFGRQAGSYPDFVYGPDMIAAGAAGLVWDEENFLKYVQGPTPYLKELLGNPKAKGKMAYNLKTEADAQNVYAYLTSLFPAAPEAAAPADAVEAPTDGTAAPVAPTY